MSAMVFREPNQVLWIGCRPGHNGAQLFGNFWSTGPLADIVQVSAGIKGYITDITLTFKIVADGAMFIYWTDSANTVVENLFIAAVSAADVYSPLHIHYWPPLEIGIAHKIRASCTGAGNVIYAHVKGWEE